MARKDGSPTGPHGSGAAEAQAPAPLLVPYVPARHGVPAASTISPQVAGAGPERPPRLLVFTGAGISAKSGLRTFRAADGLWKEFDVATVCDHRTWRSNLAAVHAFYNARRRAVGEAQPNAAHRMVAEWQRRYDTVLLTQNIDDLHERAGSADVVHLHGHVREMRCTACGHVWDVGYAAWDPETMACPRVRGGVACGCRRGVKPDVVFFGEEAPRYRDLRKAIRDLRADDVAVVIGTSGAVVSIGSLLMDAPCLKVLNNLEEDTSLEGRGNLFGFHLEIYRPATEGMAVIDAVLRELLG